VAIPPSSPERIKAAFLATGDAAAAIAARTDLVDDIVVRTYAESLAPFFARGLSILAVGGFGRRELFPYSDVDVLILVERSIESAEQKDALSVFLRTLWDSGLRVSQSVRTVNECCSLDAHNVELSISLLDQRLLGGDPDLYQTLTSRLPKFFQTQRQNLITHLCDLTRERHAKFHNSIHHLEPNIKETPGGMRDLHITHWIAALRSVEDESVQPLDRARAFLSNLRCRLHYLFNRDNNVLTFDAQEQIAPEPEKWMREYYRHARDIYGTALRQMEAGEAAAEGGLLKQFQDWRSRLSNAEFSVTRERVYLKSPQQMQADPELVLRLFQFVARHGIRLALESERRLREHMPMLADHFSHSRPLWPTLYEIFAAPHGALAIRSMHETGLLLAIFPEWQAIDALVVRDFYHRYTVDEHTLVTLEAIHGLQENKDPQRKRFADLLTEIEDSATLIAALLFHDTGKGTGFKDHSERSLKLADTAFARIQMPPSQRKRALFLIEQHLSLSAVMNARDLNDAATARDLAARVGTIENLKYLALLTYADISAVNPDAMTPWRLEQLWRVYLVAHNELTRELDTERIHSFQNKASAAFLEGFPTRYLQTHTEEQIRWHMELEKLSKAAGVAVDLKREQGSYRLTVITSDRPALFASLAGVLSAFGMDILKAEAFANQSGTVLDTFSFADPMRTLELNPMEVDRLKLVVQRAALGKEDVPRMLKGRRNPSTPGKTARIQPSVAFNSQASNTATLVEIVAEDRPGLLYDVAEKFSASGCSIEVVLIDTEAHKALDVFYVTSGGKKLGEDLQTSLKRELLAVCAS
jgi:[protein-PII] uridylyltransferase